ncbi:MAG: hypothetical protein ACRDJ3_08905 [Solirubrobacteraceae bacterium]
MSGKQLHSVGTKVLSLTMIAIGIALAIQAIGGQGVLSVRLLLGLMFVAAGSLRIYLMVIRSRGT